MSRTKHPIIAASLLATCLVALGGCATGERPSFSTSQSAPGEMTGDAAVDGVLALLDEAGAAPFEGDYSILTRYGNRETNASVTQLTSAERTVKVGRITFRFADGITSTCRSLPDDCESGIQDRRISNTQVTHRFYAEEAATRLRADAGNAVGAGAGEQRQVAGQPATCVTLPVSGGDVSYCALDSGVLAIVDDADVRIELTSYRDAVGDTSGV